MKPDAASVFLKETFAKSERQAATEIQEVAR
jgi:hypothetical protein